MCGRKELLNTGYSLLVSEAGLDRSFGSASKYARTEGLIRESNQKFKIENLRGGKATSSKLGGSTSKSHFLRLLPTSGRKSGHDPQH